MKWHKNFISVRPSGKFPDMVYIKYPTFSLIKFMQLLQNNFVNYFYRYCYHVTLPMFLILVFYANSRSFSAFPRTKNSICKILFAKNCRLLLALFIRDILKIPQRLMSLFILDDFSGRPLATLLQ